VTGSIKKENNSLVVEGKYWSYCTTHEGEAKFI
jgi:hypothetical protein